MPYHCYGMIFLRYGFFSVILWQSMQLGYGSVEFYLNGCLLNMIKRYKR